MSDCFEPIRGPLSMYIEIKGFRNESGKNMSDSFFYNIEYHDIKEELYLKYSVK